MCLRIISFATKRVQFRLMSDEIVACDDENSYPSSSRVANNNLTRIRQDQILVFANGDRQHTPIPDISEYSGIAADVRFSEQSNLHTDIVRRWWQKTCDKAAGGPPRMWRGLGVQSLWVRVLLRLKHVLLPDPKMPRRGRGGFSPACQFGMDIYSTSSRALMKSDRALLSYTFELVCTGQNVCI